MIILGLIDSKPSTAALTIDGRIVSAISEERLCRMKMANGMPREAIAAVLDEAGVAPAEVDIVAVAQRALAFQPEPTPWSGWFQESNGNGAGPFYRASSTLAPVLGRFPIAWRAHHTLKQLMTRERLTKLPQLLRDAYDITAPVRFYDHHYCHATSAYYTSDFEDALVVTLDGGGDGRSGSVYLGRQGRLQPLAGVDSFNSLGNLYSYITALCGFKAEKHEGKITGLAAMGEPRYLDVLRGLVRYKHPGQIRYSVPMYHSSALQEISSRLPANFDHADLAASVQGILEEIGVQFIRYWLETTHVRQIAVAGGVFANVKFNQRVHELEAVDAFFVHPAMDDSGLAVGAAFAAEADEDLTGGNPTALMQRLSNVYYGPEYENGDIEHLLQDSAFPTEYVENIHAEIARLLADGRVVARFTGRMEYGPRALGHRTILYQTTDPSVNDWLNEHLKRTEFMPFAPATLVEYADKCYHGIDGARDPARFMTITFDCTPTMRETSPGVVHVDGTARPQIVDKTTAPDFYGILTAYHELTGIPSLINTSFNMHGEPIVCTPTDALRSFEQGNLDYLAIGNWLVKNPGAIHRTEEAKE